MIEPVFHRMNMRAKRGHVVSLSKRRPDRDNLRIDHATFLLRRELKAAKARFYTYVYKSGGKVVDVVITSPDPPSAEAIFSV